MTDIPLADLDLAVVRCVVEVACSLQDCWERISSFADAGSFLNVPSKLVAGQGGIGSVRQIGDAVLEAMVGQTDASYTYVQTTGPMAPFHYHGCVALTDTGAASCTLTYTVSYNQAPMDAERRVAELDRIGGRFQGSAEAMKRVAEDGAAA